MSLDFEDATMGQARCKVALYGGTGSGKTETALAQATKVGSTAMIATERGADFYTDRYKFKIAYTNSCLEAVSLIEKAVKAKYDCLIIDQLTHFWEQTQNDYQAREHAKFSKAWAHIERNGMPPWYAWGHIKRPYKKLMHVAMDAPINVWFLSRLAIEYKTGKDDEPVKIGEKMATEKDTPYEPHLLVKMEFAAKGGKGGKPVWYALCEKTRCCIEQGTLWESYSREPGFRDMLDPLFQQLKAGTEQQPSPELRYDENEKGSDEAEPTAVQLKLLEVLAKKGGIDDGKLVALVKAINTEEAGLVINALTAGNYGIFDNIEGWVAGIRAKGEA